MSKSKSSLSRDHDGVEPAQVVGYVLTSKSKASATPSPKKPFRIGNRRVLLCTPRQKKALSPSFRTRPKTERLRVRAVAMRF